MTKINEIINEMNILGWRVEIKTVGSNGFRDSKDDKIEVCFYRWWWHGIKVNCPVRIYGQTDNYLNIKNLMMNVSLKAKMAYNDYIGCPPKQLPNGRIVKNEDWQNETLG